MTDEQWEKLLAVIGGELVEPLPLGFIIDSPWLANWAGISMLDYFSSEQRWFEANLKAVRRFPEVIFLPGFWSEFGMCTEPSSFGAKCTWQENEMPFAGPISSGGTETEIGRAGDGGFIGLIDEVVIYNRALSDEEVMQIYLAEGFAVNSRGKLAVCWGTIKK